MSDKLYKADRPLANWERALLFLYAEAGLCDGNQPAVLAKIAGWTEQEAKSALEQCASQGFSTDPDGHTRFSA